MVTTEAYAARVASAGRVELLRLNYEILMAAIDAGEVDRALAAVSLLTESLDMRHESARALFPLYVYMNKLLIEGGAAKLAEARALAATLLAAWADVEDQPLVQLPVAGLTYGKDGMLDEYPTDEGRTFKA